MQVPYQRGAERRALYEHGTSERRTALLSRARGVRRQQHEVVMWQALPFAIAVTVAAGNVYFGWTSNTVAVVTLVLVGAAISIGLAAAMRSAARERRQESAIEASGEKGEPSGVDSVRPHR